MNRKVQLEKIVDELELICDEGFSFMNSKTGNLFHIYNTELEYAQNGFAVDDSLPDWQRSSILIASDILKSDNYILLPLKEEINEFQMMLKFCFSTSNDTITDEIYRSLKLYNNDVMILHEIILKYGIGNDWYKYKREAFKKIAIEWSKKNNIEYLLNVNEKI